MILKSYAKITSILYVIGKRSDGYHELYTLMHKIDLYDWIEIKKSAGGLNVKTSVDELNSYNNLAFKSAYLFFDKTGIKPQVEIEIEKHIPIGGGLGGGSSNAGCVLKSLNKLFDYPLSNVELFELAAEIGSDVPFFLVDGSAICKGRGEKVEKVTCNTNGYKVFLVVPNFGVSTTQVYKKFRLTKGGGVNKMAFTVEGGYRMRNIISHLHNDLESVVLREFSILKEIKELMIEQFGCGLVSGSGSTVFSIIGSEVEQKGKLDRFCLEEGFLCKNLRFAD